MGFIDGYEWIELTPKDLEAQYKSIKMGFDNDKLEEFIKDKEILKKKQEYISKIQELYNQSKLILKETDWLFLSDIEDEVAEECKNNFKNYRKEIRNILKKNKKIINNKDSYNFEIIELPIKPKIIWK